MKRIILFVAALALVALAAPAAASAHGGHGKDRNRDGLPDRWERQHQLSLKVNQAHRDQDRDRLDNKREFEHGTDPRKADTDDDGVDDAKAVSPVGTIASFTNGVLTITLANGQSVSGMVTPRTEIECEHAEAKATAAHDGGDDNSGSGSGDDRGEREDEHENETENENPAPAPAPAPAPPTTGDHHEGENENENDNCGTDALTPGTAVKEAEAELTASGLVFEEIEVVK